MNDFKKSIDDELEALKKLRDRCRKNKKYLPKGTLSAEIRNGKVYYKIRNNEMKKRAVESDPLVIQIKERRLFEVIEQRTEQNIFLLQEIRDKYLDVDPIYCRQNLPKAYQGVPDQAIADLGFLTDAQFRAEYQTDSQYRVSQRIHTLSSGEKVRSRIEVSIAEMYLARGIEFVYEPVLIMKGGIMVHPDFAVLSHVSDKVWFHEHIGNLDNEKYRQHYEWKMDQFIKNDILPMRDILFSYEKEDGTLDMRKMEKMIDTYLT